MDHRPLRRLHVYQAVKTVVGGNIRVDEALHHIGACRVSLRERAVHGRFPLLVTSCEVEENFAVPNRATQHQADGSVRHAVVIAVSLRVVLALRQRPDLLAGPPLRVLDQLLHKYSDRLVAELCDDFRHPLLAQKGCGNLRTEVTRRLARRANVGQDQAEDIFHNFAFRHQPDHRYDHAFLVHFGGDAKPARRIAADVHVVRDRRRIPLKLVPAEERRDDRDVVQVHSVAVRVVYYQRIARPQLFHAVLAHRRGHHARH